MAVYERTWRRYSGRLTPLRWRFLIITRYALHSAFTSRIFTAFLALCLLPSVVGLLFVYLSHNLGPLAQLGVTEAHMAELTLPFFQILFPWQAIPAFFVAVIVAPTLVAADLSNSALPLYLSRPVTRVDYVSGKLVVLGLLLSPITWIPGLFIFFLQSYLEGGSWWIDHYRIGLGYLVGHISWILVIAFLSLAVSAWLRYKWAARGALFGIFFVLWGLSATVNGITHTSWGDVLNLAECIGVVVIHLFNPSASLPMPLWAAWTSLIGTCLFSVLLISRKLRAHEVVR